MLDEQRSGESCPASRRIRPKNRRKFKSELRTGGSLAAAIGSCPSASSLWKVTSSHIVCRAGCATPALCALRVPLDRPPLYPESDYLISERSPIRSRHLVPDKLIGNRSGPFSTPSESARCNSLRWLRGSIPCFAWPARLRAISERARRGSDRARITSVRQIDLKGFLPMSGAGN